MRCTKELVDFLQLRHVEHDACNRFRRSPGAGFLLDLGRFSFKRCSKGLRRRFEHRVPLWRCLAPTRMCSIGQTSREIDIPPVSRNDPPTASLNRKLGTKCAETALCGPACSLSGSKRRKDIPHNDQRFPDMRGHFRQISLIPGLDASLVTCRAMGRSL